MRAIARRSLGSLGGKLRYRESGVAPTSLSFTER